MHLSSSLLKLFASLSVILFTACPTLAKDGDPTTVSPARVKFPPVFQQVSAQLAKSKVPVYLPTWLPKYFTAEPLYATVSLAPLKGEKGDYQGYSIVLASTKGEDPPMASQLMTISGYDSFPLKATKKKTAVGKSLQGYVTTDGQRPTVEWTVGKVHYELVAGAEIYEIAKTIAPMDY